MKIAIVILNWNGKALLEQFLPSIIAYSKEATIYVADNASTDDSVTFVKKQFPEVKIIENKTNGGYAKGYNDALKQLDEDIYCLINSDIEVTKNWLEPIINKFKAEENTAIIQPKILEYKQKSHFEYAGAAGGFIDKYGYAFCRGRVFNAIEKDTNQYQTDAIFWASGACLFIRKNVFHILNGFDESYFAHYEEIDLCWRAFNLGFETKCVVESTVYHVGGATLSNTNPKKTYLNFRNSLFTITKNANGFLFGLIFTRLILDGLAGIQFLFQFKFGHFFAILQAHFSYYANLPQLLKTRKSLSQKKGYFYTKSIVFQHFLSQKDSFQDISR